MCGVPASLATCASVGGGGGGVASGFGAAASIATWASLACEPPASFETLASCAVGMCIAPASGGGVDVSALASAEDASIAGGRPVVTVGSRGTKPERIELVPAFAWPFTAPMLVASLRGDSSKKQLAPSAHTKTMVPLRTAIMRTPL
jgi:hypothetical protein